MKQSKHGLLRIGATLVAAMLLGISATAFAADEGGDAEKIELVNPGTLTVCTHLPYKPFQFLNEEREVVGFDVALVKLLAEDLGVDLEVISIAWNQITSGAVFAAGKCDLAMGGATITEKRAEAVLFSDPYFSATQVLLTRDDSGISGLEDMEGKRLGVQVATTGKLYAEKFADKYGYIPVVYADLALLTTAVRAGAVDAAIQDSGPLIKYAQSHPETEVVASFDTGEYYGFMAQKDDPNATRLMNRFNELLAEAKADGTYKKIYEKWFGEMPEEAAQK